MTNKRSPPCFRFIIVIIGTKNCDRKKVGSEWEPFLAEYRVMTYFESSASISWPLSRMEERRLLAYTSGETSLKTDWVARCRRMRAISKIILDWAITSKSVPIDIVFRGRFWLSMQYHRRVIPNEEWLIGLIQSLPALPHTADPAERRISGTWSSTAILSAAGVMN